MPVVGIHMPLVSHPGINNTYTKEGGNNTQEPILDYPVFLQSELKLSCLVQQIDGDRSGKIQVSNKWPVYLLNICAQNLILPLCGIRIIWLTLCTPFSFIEQKRMNLEQQYVQSISYPFFSLSFIVSRGILRLKQESEGHSFIVSRS